MPCADATCGAATDCPVCRLAARSPAHRDAVLRSVARQTRKPRPVRKAKAAPPACPHLGERTGESVPCASCKRDTPRTMPVYRCGLHGLTVIGDRRPKAKDVTACRWCPDRPRS